MILRVTLPDGHLHELEAENTGVGHLATQAATQMDAHRDRQWTLDGADPALAADAAGFIDGQTVTLTEITAARPSLFRRLLNRVRPSAPADSP